jgi:hypothetical protein
VHDLGEMIDLTELSAGRKSVLADRSCASEISALPVRKAIVSVAEARRKTVVARPAALQVVMVEERVARINWALYRALPLPGLKATFVTAVSDQEIIVKVVARCHYDHIHEPSADRSGAMPSVAVPTHV